MRAGGALKRFLLEVVVSPYAIDGCLEGAEEVEHLGLSDIACMDDSVDPGAIEDFDNSTHALEVVVGVSDNTDSHGDSPICPSDRG